MSQAIPIIFVGRVPAIALGIIEEMKPEIEGMTDNYTITFLELSPMQRLHAF